MSNNYGGNYETTLHAMMQAYDKLPSKVRDMLQQSNENWVPQPVLTHFRRACRKKWSSEAEQECCAIVARWDEEEREEHWYRMHRLQERNIDYDVPIRRRRKNKS